MRKEYHEKRAIELTGKPYTEVHEWLDELFAYVGAIHRSARHNEAGVKYVRDKWGEEAARVARQHIKDDGEYPGPEEDNNPTAT